MSTVSHTCYSLPGAVYDKLHFLCVDELADSRLLVIAGRIRHSLSAVKAPTLKTTLRTALLPFMVQLPLAISLQRLHRCSCQEPPLAALPRTFLLYMQGTQTALTATQASSNSLSSWPKHRRKFCWTLTVAAVLR